MVFFSNCTKKTNLNSFCPNTCCPKKDGGEKKMKKYVDDAPTESHEKETN